MITTQISMRTGEQQLCKMVEDAMRQGAVLVIVQRSLCNARKGDMMNHGIDISKLTFMTPRQLYKADPKPKPKVIVCDWLGEHYTHKHAFLAYIRSCSTPVWVRMREGRVAGSSESTYRI